MAIQGFEGFAPPTAKAAKAAKVEAALARISSFSNFSSRPMLHSNVRPREGKPERSSTCDTTYRYEDLPFRFAERAGIAEHDGGIPRGWADGLARLDTMPRPNGWSTERWHRLIDDAARFADRWAAQAAALGWTVHDVFGVDPSAPDVRYDCMGLVPLLDGRPVVAITAKSARIRTATGAAHTFMRRSESGAVAIWELTAPPGEGCG